MERALVYGDLLFETMKYEQGHIPHFDKHMARLAHGMQVLNMQCSQLTERVNEHIQQALQGQSRVRIRLVVQRAGNGFYFPDSHEVKMHAECFPLIEKANTPLTVCVYAENYKACTPLSNLKSGNALVYVLAAMHAQRMACDDALVLNEHGRVCEATASNIFIREGSRWITPPLSEGCVAGIMRAVLLSEMCAIEETVSIDRVRNADEIVLTNAIQGSMQVAKIL